MSEIPKNVVDVAKSATKGVTSAVSGVTDVAKSATKGVTSAVSGVTDVAKSATKGVTSAVSGVTDVAKSATKGVTSAVSGVTDVAKSATKGVTSAVSGVTDVAKSATSIATGSVKKNLQDIKINNPLQFSKIMYAIGAAIVLFVVAYLLYIYISRKLANRVAWKVPNSGTPILTNDMTVLSGDGMPRTIEGGSSFMFWIYINDLEETRGKRRNVFFVGSETEKNLGWHQRKSYYSPNVIINAQKNMMHIFFRYVHIRIPFIPTKRWVHVAVSVAESYKRGEISVYVDGELHQTLKPSTHIKYYGFDNKGDVYIGGNLTTKIPGFQGLVSNIAFANYPLKSSEIYKEYVKGPIDNFASKIGLNGYGVRSPVYRIR
jgi:hypothetical protein